MKTLPLANFRSMKRGLIGLGAVLLCPILLAPPAMAITPPNQPPSTNPKETGRLVQPPRRSTLPITVVAILFAPPPHDQAWSTVVFRNSISTVVHAFRLGDRIDGASITGIAATRVFLMNRGMPEYVDLLEKPGEPTPPPKAIPRVVSAHDSPLTQSLKRGIKQASEHAYEIRRDTLESVLANLPALLGSAQAFPEIRNGQVAGFRLAAVRANGPFDLIGLRNGDLIASLNGLEITSPEKGLEAYAKLKSAGHLSLGLERDGRKFTKDYTIR